MLRLLSQASRVGMARVVVSSLVQVYRSADRVAVLK